MSAPPSKRDALSREDAHPKAREALEDFFWDAGDPCSPFGCETGLDVLDALRDARVEDPRGDLVELLGELLARWEIEDAHWDVVDADEVQTIGEVDELGLLTRDEAILALAFGQIIVEGRVDAEVRRRAMLALVRQALPALLRGFGDRMHARADRIQRMSQALAKRWD